MFRQALRLARMPLDGNEQRPALWAALLGGAGLGLTWGVASRIWMRLISTRPEFSIAGTAMILGIATIFGTFVGLGFAARRRGWTGWRYWAARVAVVITFLPFGGAGGGPLMATVFLGTLALTQRALVGAWILSIPAAVMGVSGPRPYAFAVPAVALVLSAWTWAVRRDQSLQRADRWIDLALRAVPLAGAAALFVHIARDIIRDKPEPRSLLYVLLYLLLLYPLYLGLRVGFGPAERTAGPAQPEKVEQVH